MAELNQRRWIRFRNLLFISVATLVAWPAQVYATGDSKPRLPSKATSKPIDACTPMDLNKSDPLANMIVHDQSKTGMCYAFSATVLMEFELKSKGKNSSALSPVDVARSFKEDYGVDKLFGDLSGGGACGAIESASKKGILPHNCVENAFAEILQSTSYSSTLILEILEREDAIKIGLPDEEYAYKKDLIKNAITTCDVGGKKYDFSKINQALLLKIFTDKCEKERIKTPPLLCDVIYNGTDKQMLGKLNSILDQGKPAELGVCINSILNGKRFFVGETNREMKKKAAEIECGSHAVPVTARRPVDGKCQYLIRNSWGKNWGGPWDGSLGLFKSCACKTPDGTYYEDCSKLDELLEKKAGFPIADENSSKYATSIFGQSDNREYVGCWINGDQLPRNMTEVGSIK